MDIFKEIGERGEFFKFVNVGDNVQGTYVDTYRGTDSFKNEQVVYVLKDENGKLWNVGVKTSAGKTIEKMNKVRFGQIVGFRLDKMEESKTYKGKMVKYINPAADIKFIDKEWIDEQTKIVAALGLTLAEYQAEKMGQTFSSGEDTHGNWDEGEPFLSTPTAATHEATGTYSSTPTGVDDTMTAIHVLATNKGLVPPGSIPLVANALIEGFVGMPVTPENYTKVIVKLSSFTK